jgi:hypothetical protein
MNKVRMIAAVLAATGLMAGSFAEAAQGGGGGGGGAGGGGGGGGGGKKPSCVAHPVPGQPGTFIVTCSTQRP